MRAPIGMPIRLEATSIPKSKSRRHKSAVRIGLAPPLECKQTETCTRPLLLEQRVARVDVVQEHQHSWIEIDGGGQSTSRFPQEPNSSYLQSGSTITFEKNGSTIFSITDTSLTGGSPGIATDGSPILDNWTGGISPSRLGLTFAVRPDTVASGGAYGFAVSGVTLATIKCIKISYLTTLSGEA